MSKRKKPVVEAIKDLDGARSALAELAGLGRELAVIEAELNAKVDLAKAEAEAEARGPKARIKELELSLAAYAETNRETLFQARKSVDLAFGVLGFRRSTEVKPAARWTWGAVLERLKELGESAAIRVKESVNKEELHRWTDSRLETAGCRRVVQDRFFYEISDEALAETEAA